MGALETLVKLLDVHLPLYAPLMTKSADWGGFGGKGASASRNPAYLASHSGRMGGATKSAAQRMSQLRIQRAGRWKSRASIVYIGEAGEGAQESRRP